MWAGPTPTDTTTYSVTYLSRDILATDNYYMWAGPTPDESLLELRFTFISEGGKG